MINLGIVPLTRKFCQTLCFCFFFLQLKFYCMLLWNNFNFSLCQCKLTVFRNNLTCVFNSDKLGKQESVPLGESFTHNALVSFYVIVLHCKCYFIVCQICHSQVFLLSEWRLAPQKNWSVCMAHRRLLEWMSLHSQRKLFKNSRVQL